MFSLLLLDVKLKDCWRIILINYYNNSELGLWVRVSWIPIPNLLLTRSVTLSKLVNLFKLLAPYSFYNRLYITVDLWSIIIAKNAFEHLLCVRNWSKCFPCINPFNAYCMFVILVTHDKELNKCLLLLIMLMNQLKCWLLPKNQK